MLLGGFSARAWRQLKESTAWGRRDRRSFSGSYLPKQASWGASATFSWELLWAEALARGHAQATLQLHCNHAYVWHLILAPNSELFYPLNFSPTSSYGGAWCPGFWTAPLACPPSSLGVVGQAPAGKGPALPTLEISLAPSPWGAAPWGFPRIIHLGFIQSICYQKEYLSFNFLTVLHTYFTETVGLLSYFTKHSLWNQCGAGIDAGLWKQVYKLRKLQTFGNYMSTHW